MGIAERAEAIREKVNYELPTRVTESWRRVQERIRHEAIEKPERTVFKLILAGGLAVAAYNIAGAINSNSQATKASDRADMASSEGYFDTAAQLRDKAIEHDSDVEGALSNVKLAILVSGGAVTGHITAAALDPQKKL